MMIDVIEIDVIDPCSRQGERETEGQGNQDLLPSRACAREASSGTSKDCQSSLLLGFWDSNLAVASVSDFSGLQDEITVIKQQEGERPKSVTGASFIAVSINT